MVDWKRRIWEGKGILIIIWMLSLIQMCPQDSHCQFEFECDINVTVASTLHPNGWHPTPVVGPLMAHYGVYQTPTCRQPTCDARMQVFVIAHVSNESAP